MELLIAAVMAFFLAAIVGFFGCKLFDCCRPELPEDQNRKAAIQLLSEPSEKSPPDEIDGRIFQMMCTPPMWFLVFALLVLPVAAQDVVPPFSLQEIEAGKDEPAYVPIEKRVDKEKHRDRKRNRDEDQKPDLIPSPQPDQQPGEGETVIVDPDFGELVVEPIESHADREAKRKAREEAAKRRHEEAERHAAEREKLRQEQEEYDRLHPKPAAPTGLIGFIWSWVIGPSLWAICAPFAWLFTLIKWGGMLFLLIVLALLVTAIVFFGSVAWRGLVWCWSKIGSMWSRKT